MAKRSRDSLIPPTKITTIGPVITPLPSVDGDVLGGFQVTGFVDVEQTLSFKNKYGVPRTLLLEKKLPFQMTIIELEGSPSQTATSVNSTLFESESKQPIPINVVSPPQDSFNCGGKNSTSRVSPKQSININSPSPNSNRTKSGGKCSTLKKPFVFKQPIPINKDSQTSKKTCSRGKCST